MTDAGATPLVLTAYDSYRAFSVRLGIKPMPIEQWAKATRSGWNIYGSGVDATPEKRRRPDRPMAAGE